MGNNLTAYRRECDIESTPKESPSTDSIDKQIIADHIADLIDNKHIEELDKLFADHPDYLTKYYKSARLYYILKNDLPNLIKSFDISKLNSNQEIVDLLDFISNHDAADFIIPLITVWRNRFGLIQTFNVMCKRGAENSAIKLIPHLNEYTGYSSNHTARYYSIYQNAANYKCKKVLDYLISNNKHGILKEFDRHFTEYVPYILCKPDMETYAIRFMNCLDTIKFVTQIIHKCLENKCYTVIAYLLERICMKAILDPDGMDNYLNNNLNQFIEDIIAETDGMRIDRLIQIFRSMKCFDWFLKYKFTDKTLAILRANSLYYCMGTEDVDNFTIIVNRIESFQYALQLPPSLPVLFDFACHRNIVNAITKLIDLNRDAPPLLHGFYMRLCHYNLEDQAIAILPLLANEYKKAVRIHSCAIKLPKLLELLSTTYNDGNDGIDGIELTPDFCKSLPTEQILLNYLKNPSTLKYISDHMSDDILLHWLDNKYRTAIDIIMPNMPNCKLQLYCPELLSKFDNLQYVEQMVSIIKANYQYHMNDDTKYNNYIANTLKILCRLEMPNKVKLFLDIITVPQMVLKECNDNYANNKIHNILVNYIYT